jgi:hypothetical protein
VPALKVAECPRPDHVLLHLSDTHLIAGEERLYGAVDADARLRRLLDRVEAARIVPSALVSTGDLVDAGEPAAYRKLRAAVEPFAARLAFLIPAGFGKALFLDRALYQEGRVTGLGGGPARSSCAVWPAWAGPRGHDDLPRPPARRRGQARRGGARVLS